MIDLLAPQSTPPADDEVMREIEAMADVARELDPLTVEVRSRVLAWAWDRLVVHGRERIDKPIIEPRPPVLR